MAQRRRYTAKQRAEAVGIAALSTVEAAAAETGIPRTTIDYWMDKPEFVALRNKTSDDVADAMSVAIQLGISRIVELIPSTEDLAKVGVAVGILYDKRALLTGGATGRMESRDLTGTLSDRDVIEAVREAQQVTSAGGTAAADPEPAAG